MALSKTDQVRFDGLQQTLKMLLGTLELAQIESMMAPQIKEFEESTNHQIKFKKVDDDVVLELQDLSKDYLRVRGTDPYKVLRSRVEGVPVEVKISKDGDYSFTNRDTVSALRALADEVESLTFELTTLSTVDDVRKKVSELSQDEDSSGESTDVEEFLDAGVVEHDDMDGFDEINVDSEEETISDQD